MSASSKKKLHAEEANAKLTEKQLAQQKEDKKVKAYTIAFAIVLVVLVLVAAFVGINRAVSNSGSREKKTVALTLGDTTLSNAELSYYFIDTVNNFYSQNGTYAALYGLDTTKALDQQVFDADAGTTWADYFLSSAEQSARATYAIAKEAAANGYELSESDQSQLDSLESTLSLHASVYGYSKPEAYLKAMYGNGATLDSYKEYYRVNLLASGYQTEYRDSLTYTDEQVEAKDAEDPAVYNSYSYNQYYLSSSRYLDDDATNAEKAAAAAPGIPVAPAAEPAAPAARQKQSAGRRLAIALLVLLCLAGAGLSFRLYRASEEDAALLQSQQQALDETEQDLQALREENDAAQTALVVYIERPINPTAADADLVEAKRILETRFPRVRFDLVYFHLPADGAAGPYAERTVADGITAVACDYKRLDHGEVSHAIRANVPSQYIAERFAVPDRRTDEEKAAYAKGKKEDRRRKFGGRLNELKYRLYRKLEEELQEKGIVPRDFPLWFD